MTDYERIASPDDAQRFISTYSGEYDPKKLLGSAMKKGYSTGIKNAQDCIVRANDVVKMQKEISETVGFIDKAAMYHAGASIVQCRNRLERYRMEAAKFK